MTQSIVVHAHDSAIKELSELPINVQKEMRFKVKELTEIGYLKFPDCRKINGTELWEIRVKVLGSWRGLYCYLDNSRILILSFFNKKSQKTPLSEIRKAQKRLRLYKL